MWPSGARPRGRLPSLLDQHLQDRLRGLEQPKDRWGRLQWSVAYDILRRALGWPADIYYVANPGGGVHIVNFSDDWHDLQVRGLRGTHLYWELINGWPYFKIGPIPKGSDARELRTELRDLLETSAKAEGLLLVVTGRTGEYMSLARGDTCLADFFGGAKLAAEKATAYLETCRRVHERTIAAWRRR